MRKFLLICICLVFAGCATYTGDKLVSLTYLSPESESYEHLLKLEGMLLRLYKELGLAEQRKIPIDSISTYELIREDQNIKLSHERKKVFLIDGDIHISYCDDSVVIATGNIDISHGSNNILISGKNIEVSHDRGGSIVVARESVDIAFAVNTTVYAPEGLEISHPSNVIAYNTGDLKISWGHVNNVLNRAVV